MHVKQTIEQTTYVSNILIRISPLTRHHNNRSLHIRTLESLPITTKRGIVDKRKMVILASRIANLEVRNLRATPLRQRSINRISSILLREHRSTEQRERSESRERHRDGDEETKRVTVG
jgi:hypothetical protein